MIALDDGVDAAVTAAADVLRDGGVVVLPTDTVYGLAGLPSDRRATERLFALKGRTARTPIAVLCADVDQALELADVAARAALGAVGDRWWPGPLTMVVRRAPGIDLHLGEPIDTIGLRVPDHAFVGALAAAVGPIAVTSANRHGEPTLPTASATAASLHGRVELIVDGGRLDGSASTVIDASHHPWEVLREGPLPSAEILAASG